jgi:hypothetical protein
VIQLRLHFEQHGACIRSHLFVIRTNGTSAIAGSLVFATEDWLAVCDALKRGRCEVVDDGADDAFGVASVRE